MKICTEQELRPWGQRLLEAAGVPADEASIVADELVTTSLQRTDTMAAYGNDHINTERSSS